MDWAATVAHKVYKDGIVDNAARTEALARASEHKLAGCCGFVDFTFLNGTGSACKSRIFPQGRVTAMMVVVDTARRVLAVETFWPEGLQTVSQLFAKSEVNNEAPISKMIKLPSEKISVDNAFHCP